RFQGAADANDDRGRRLRGFARKQRSLRQYQMDAGGLDAVDGANGARQLALERAQMIDVLHEARGAERVRFVEDFVADAAALGQAALGEFHAKTRDLLLGYQQSSPVVLDVVGDALPLEILDDRRGVFEREVG